MVTENDVSMIKQKYIIGGKKWLLHSLSVLYLWMNKVSVKGRRCYTCNIFPRGLGFSKSLNRKRAHHRVNVKCLNRGASHAYQWTGSSLLQITTSRFFGIKSAFRYILCENATILFRTCPMHGSCNLIWFGVLLCSNHYLLIITDKYDGHVIACKVNYRMTLLGFTVQILEWMNNCNFTLQPDTNLSHYFDKIWMFTVYLLFRKWYNYGCMTYYVNTVKSVRLSCFPCV